MKLRSWTVFIDMLGYRDKNGSVDDDKKAEEFLLFMQGCKQLIDLYNDSSYLAGTYRDSSFQLYDYYTVSSIIVSDSIILSFKPKEIDTKLKRKLALFHSANVLFIIATRLTSLMYYCLREKGIFFRGGISGKYCKVSDGFAVGSGLVEAYSLESKTARYPRVVISESIIKDRNLSRCLTVLNEQLYPGFKLIKKDSDGVSYLDCLGLHVFYAVRSPVGAYVLPEDMRERKAITLQYLKLHKETIIANLNELDKKIRVAGTGDEKLKGVRSKYVWLANYHDKCAKKIDDNLRIGDLL